MSRHGDLANFLLHENGAATNVTALYEAAGSRHWTYGELRSEVARRAARLTGSRGLVFLALTNDSQSVVAYLGALAAGHAVAILDPSMPAAAAVPLFERYRPEWCLLPPGEAVCAAMPDGYRMAEISEFPGRWWRRADSSGDPALHPDLRVLLSTSGSTGSPKFVRLSTANLTINANDIIAALGIAAADRAITSLPLHYSFGLSILHTHLRAGASVVVTDRVVSDSAFWSLLGESKCTSFAGVPFSYRLIRRLNFTKLNVPSLIKMTQAGGALDLATAGHFHELMDSRSGKFFVMYGQTEASPRMTTLAHGDFLQKQGSVGVPLRSGRVWISDAEARDGRDIGEVYYAGPNVMMGYAQERLDLIKGDEMNGVLATGDTGYIDSDGYLYLRGRSSRIAKILGRRINLDEVEAMVARHGPCAAVQKQEELVVFVAANDTSDAVRFELLRDLSIHPACLRVVEIPALPTRSNGKIDYAVLSSG